MPLFITPINFSMAAVWAYADFTRLVFIAVVVCNTLVALADAQIALGLIL
ncbi:MAG: hypothetical protein WC782_04155 [Methylococcaceae bacterium]